MSITTIARQAQGIRAVSAGNTSQTPTALGPQLEDPRRTATSKAVPATVVVAPEVVTAAAVVVAAAVGVHLMASVEELVEAATAEVEATRVRQQQRTWRLRRPP
jgi:hypothetical protein